MQFKATKNPNLVQIIAYRGYDKEKRRAITKLLGSIDLTTFKYDEKVLIDMSDDEKKELSDYIDKERLSRAIAEINRFIDHAPITLKSIAEKVVSGEISLSDEQITVLTDALDEFKKAMRKVTKS